MASPSTTTAFQSTSSGAANLSASSIPTSTTFATDDVTSKVTYSSKVGNAKARFSENTAAATVNQRQSASPKAWASGTNPLTQRSSNPNQRNGTSSQSQSQSATSGPNSPVLREGLKVRVALDTGAEFEGLYTSGTDSSFNLKMVQQKRLPNSADMSNGNVKIGREQSAMSFPKRDVADIHVTGTALPNKSTRPQNGNPTIFRTDGAISGNKFQGERALKPWVGDDSIETEMSLEINRNRSSNWDQFEANSRLFGLKTDYDENIYTTKIDKSHPDYVKKYAEADRKAREIESSIANNSHVAEERVVDNLTVDDSGVTEEEKYSGVHRQEVQQDFPPLAPTGRSNKYTPPGRRAPQTQPPSQAPPPGSLADPAIISSSLARKDSPAADKGKNNSTQGLESSHAGKIEMKALPKAVESKPATAAATEGKAISPTPENSGGRNSSPQTRPGVTPNATATVERDVVSAFKGFAAQQRVQADKLRSNKAKADKEVKLHELKKFAANFKLNSPVPSDLVSIIAKDPAKQREIQEKAKRDAEEQAEKARQAKASAEAASSVIVSSDVKTTQRAAAAPAQVSVSSTNGGNRSNHGRSSGYPAQGHYNSQQFRGDRSTPNQPILTNNGRPVQPLGARLRSLEQSKSTQVTQSHDGRQPPTGPANSVDPSFSRRSSGAVSMISAKLNPNSSEFRPSPFAAPFNPNGNPSSGSSPRSSSVSAPNQPVIVSTTTVIRRRPLSSNEKSPAGASKLTYNDIIESVAAIQPPPSVAKKWEGNGGFKPAYDTLPTWRQIGENEPADSSMHQTYVKMFDNSPFATHTMSPPQPSHVHPQVPHQHQLPFHLQQGAHMPQRQSPRQPQIHLHNQHNHGQNNMFNPSDEHRMMPSHSAQSFASPRLQAVNMAYASPMSQPAQLAYNQQMMQYPMAPNAPQYRSYSGGNQYVPQQASHMGGPVMIPAPAGNGFMGPGGMVSPAPQMMYSNGGPHFIPPGGGPPPIPGQNGYPSPGRSAPMMMTQGSQSGQSAYGVSPGMQYGNQPMYAQQQPGQMPIIRSYPSGQQFGTSPQMHLFGAPPHRGTPSSSYNKNYMVQHGPHPPAPQNQIPSGPQGRPMDGGDDVK